MLLEEQNLIQRDRRLFMANAETLIFNAKKYIGTPYVWGGESKAEGGFDCSGYIYNVLNDSGIKVGRTTAQGYSSLGTSVTTIEKAKPGDLLYFGKSTKNITHIAMYAGNGKMYESVGGSNNTKNNPGKGVTLNSVSRRKDLVLIKRVSESKPSANPAKYFPKYTGKSCSIVDGLKAVKANSTFTYRKKIASANKISMYIGSPSQNKKMLTLLKDGKLIKP